VRPAVNTLRVPGVRLRVWIAALVVVPLAAAAQEPGPGQEGENRWVASLATTSGVLIEQQHGSVESCLFANPADATGCPAPGSMPLRSGSSGHTRAVAAFVGANLEAMTPALPIPTRPRLFLSGEIVPIFASSYDLAVQGNPGCVRGPEPGDPCARDEVVPRDTPFGEDAANGQGSLIETTFETLGFGANLGIAFPFSAGERRLRIKPSVGWLSYEVQAEGTVVDAECEPSNRCTDVDPGSGIVSPGLLRETILTATDTQRFHAIGPGLDLEVDTGRFGPLGTSIFLGARFYRTLGDRSMELDTVQVYGDDGLPLANQAVAAHWEAELDPWMYRVGVGFRVQWLGSAQ
jgi:hypothetical protein